jgi:magnesium transporter
MTRYLKKQKNEIGLSPQELVFRGKKKIDQVLLRLIDFSEDTVEV